MTLRLMWFRSGQVALGFFIHHKYDPQRTKKPVRNIGHIV